MSNKSDFNICTAWADMTSYSLLYLYPDHTHTGRLLQKLGLSTWNGTIKSCIV